MSQPLNFIQRFRFRSKIRHQRFWFVDVPRTSSSSVRSELAKRFGPVNGKANIDVKEHATKQWIPDHTTADRMKKILGPAVWNQIFTFSIVRNPWDRIASLYYYMKKRNSLPDGWDFSNFVTRLEHATGATPEFRYHGRRFGAADYLTDSSGQLIVDQIIKFEERERGLQMIGEKIGFPKLGQVHVLAAKPKAQHYSALYTPNTQRIIEERYAMDIELFGYSFEDKT